MTTYSRRTVLLGTTGLAALVAGCLDQAGVDPTSDGEGDEGDGENGSENDGSGNGADELDDYEEPAATAEVDGVESVSFYHTTTGEPDAELLQHDDDADGWLHDRGFGDDDRATAFVDQTRFDESVIVAIEATARNACYEMVLETVEYDLDDATLEVVADVTDEHADDDAACAQVQQTVGHLIRADISDEPSGSVTIVDQDGTQHAFGFDTESDHETGDDGENETDGSDGSEG